MSESELPSTERSVAGRSNGDPARSLLLYLMVFSVGLPSWLLINSIFTQLGVLSSDTPEGGAVASYLSVMIQLGNIPVFVYAVLRERFPKVAAGPGLYTALILAIFVCAFATSLLLALGWDHTMSLFGSQYSVWLWIGAVLGGVIGSMSVVSMFAWAAQVGSEGDGRYMAALSTGMGCSGLVSSGIALLTGAFGANVGVFFVVNAIVILAILAAFLSYLFLSIVGVCTEERTASQDFEEGMPVRESSVTLAISTPLAASTGPQGTTAIAPLLEHIMSVPFIAHVIPNSHALESDLYQLLNSLMFFYVYAIVPYMATESAYGDDAQRIVSIISIGAIICGALSRFVPTFRRLQCFFQLPMTVVQVIGNNGQLALFIMLNVVAFVQSSEVPPSLPIVGMLLLALFNGYQNSSLYVHVSKLQPIEEKEKVSRHVGFAQQVGAFVGAVLAFGMVQAGAYG